MTRKDFLALLVTTALVHLGIFATLSNSRFYQITLLFLFWLFMRRLLAHYGSDGRINPARKSVLITGCDSGFGNQLAKRLDSLGFHVFACCLFPEGSGAEDLKQICSARLTVLPLDVTKEESISSALEFVKEHIGSNSLWAVVNNAGINKGSAVDLSTIDHFRQTIAVNALGPVMVSKAFLPLLKESKGRIVNVSSLQGRVPIPNLCPYTMSKHAVRAFSECLSLEMIPWDVRVINVEPGPFRTPIMDSRFNVSRLKAEKEEIDESILSSYGEEYFQQMEKIMTSVEELSCNNIGIVVDAMESAITKIHPEHVYKPRQKFIIRFGASIYENMPFSVQTKMFLLVSKILHFPVPCAVKM